MFRTAVAAVGGAALLLAGCSSSSTSSDTSSAASQAAHNTADVTFATDMIPHHRQAVEMADMVSGRAASSAVTSLAAQIKSEQQPEIDTMTGWLQDWNKPVPSASMSGTDHGSMGSMSHGDGMMSATEMTQLAGLRGAAFDRMWVTMMITHHQGAVTMSRTELSKGQDAQAKALARSIIAGQTKEIATMKTLLTKLPSS